MARGSKTVWLDNTYLVRQAISEYNAETDSYEPYTGDVPAPSCYFATDAAGDNMIPGTGPYMLVETPATPGTWYYKFPSTVVALLRPSLGETVFQVVVAGGVGDLRDVQPLLVQAGRFPE